MVTGCGPDIKVCSFSIRVMSRLLAMYTEFTTGVGSLPSANTSCSDICGLGRSTDKRVTILVRASSSLVIAVS